MHLRTFGTLIALVVAWLVVPAAASAQDPPTSQPAVAAATPRQAPAPPPDPLAGYTPITLRQRLTWTIDSTVGPTAWASGALATTWYTAWNVPSEWGQGATGIGKRIVDHQASAGASNAIEAGLGAFWGEDPRYPRMGGRRVGARVKNVFADLAYAPYPDGRRHFAYARLVAAFGNNAIENLWLPPSSRDWQSTVRRAGYAYLAHLAMDAWQEFWPDLRTWLKRKLARQAGPTGASPGGPGASPAADPNAKISWDLPTT